MSGKTLHEKTVDWLASNEIPLGLILKEGGSIESLDWTMLLHHLVAASDAMIEDARDHLTVNDTSGHFQSIVWQEVCRRLELKTYLVYHNGQVEVVIAPNEIEACWEVVKVKYPQKWADESQLGFDLYVELITLAVSGVSERGERKTITSDQLFLKV